MIMWQDSEQSQMDVADEKLTSANHQLTWVLMNIDKLNIPKNQQKNIKRHIIAAKQSIDSGLKLIDKASEC